MANQSGSADVLAVRVDATPRTPTHAGGRALAQPCRRCGGRPRGLEADPETDPEADGAVAEPWPIRRGRVWPHRLIGQGWPGLGHRTVSLGVGLEQGGSGWAPSGQASPWEQRAAHSRQVRPEEAQEPSWGTLSRAGFPSASGSAASKVDP